MTENNLSVVPKKRARRKQLSPEAQVMGMLQTALENGVDADSLEKLLNMQERVLDRQAEQAYSISMVEVQKKMPAIVKNRENDQTNSSYSDLKVIIKTITPVYTAEGFALSFGNAESPLADHVRVTCDVMHSSGFSKHYFTDTPLDLTGIKGAVNKTKTHGTGSANSYGRRYLTCLIFNLNTGNDDDGNAAGGPLPETLSEEQLLKIDSMIKENELPEARVMSWLKEAFKVDRFDDLYECNYEAVITRLNMAIKAKSE